MAYFIPIFLCTFVLEDLALASSLALISQNKMSIAQAFLACAVGISLGDVAVYLIGYGSSQFAFLERLRFVQKYRPALEKIGQSQMLTLSIIISRAIPGLRIPTYLGAGFLRYSPWRFFWLTIVSVVPWVFLALFGGRELIRAFLSHWQITLAAVLIFAGLVKLSLPRLKNLWPEKALP